MRDKLPYEIIFSHINGFKIEDTVIIDILDIFATIYIHDITTVRNKNTSLNVTIPVNNIDLWNKSVQTINSLVNFMTNYVDNWTITFEETKIKKIIKKSRLFYNNDIYTPQKIALFSGGLDSFAGICKELQSPPTKLFLPGYKINNHEYHSQKVLFKDFISKIDSTTKFQVFTLGKVKKKEPTQRTRSLLFFALGIVMARIHNKNNLELFENGIMSLNPEINHSRYTTKTTHPATITMMNSILKESNIDCIINHPFLFNTKAEMISNIPTDSLSFIKETITCGRNRQDIRFDSSKKQCGACVPCILRKISMAYLGYEKYDANYDINYDQKITKKHPLQDEYKSSIRYYMDYMNSINNDEIFDVLNPRSKNYSDPNWFNKTQKMLKQFSEEVNFFINKYKILE